MAKTLTKEEIIAPKANQQQQRKKQAKKEAKVMLKIEKAKKEIQKAEQKVAKAQGKLEASTTHLHDLEEKLAQANAPASHNHSLNGSIDVKQPDTQKAETSQPQEETATSTDNAADEDTAGDVLHESSQLPAEGRTDIGAETGNGETGTAVNATETNNTSEEEPASPVKTKTRTRHSQPKQDPESGDESTHEIENSQDHE